MKLIVGLGNPGPEYETTRHNAGFMIVEALAAKHRIAIDTHERDALTGRGRIAGQPVLLARPVTYMNRSGEAVAKLVRKYLDSPEDLRELIVVHDDIDLDLGTIRIRERGSAGTHNGMRSIISSLETEEFARVRFGVRGDGYENSANLADYVLETFTSEEMTVVDETVRRASEALLVIVRGDLRRAMTTFNRVPDDRVPEGESR
jgi:peptidyl-tRNA hydrolase, PTH1 family